MIYFYLRRQPVVVFLFLEDEDFNYELRVKISAWYRYGELKVSSLET